MAYPLTGEWSIRVKYKNPPAYPQRFVITGAISGNGTYVGETSTPAFTVIAGNNCQINPQALDGYLGSGTKWINSVVVNTLNKNGNGKQIVELYIEDHAIDGSVDLILELTRIIPPPPPPVAPKPPLVDVPKEPPIVDRPKPKPPKIDSPPISPGKVFTALTDSDRLPIKRIKSTYGIWLDPSGSNIGNMVTYFTCSAETSASYNRTIYQTICDELCATPHFNIAYGNIDGSGSNDLGGRENYTQTAAIYGQYRSLCLPPAERMFKFGKKDVKHFYAINVRRDRMGDRFDEGNFELNLHHLSGSQFLAGNGNRNAHTGSNVRLGSAGNILRLIDDSKLDYTRLSSDSYQYFYNDVSASLAYRFTHGGEMYYVVSGTLENGISSTTDPKVYGALYPRLGVILLDADILDVSASFLTVTGSDVAGANELKLFTSISGAAKYTDVSGDYLGFQARRVKYEYLEQYFVRVKNQDYNFTNNPSYQSGSEGLIIEDFVNNPQVYVTQIGLYNAQKELLAVGKINLPIRKNYTTEGLYTVKLRYE